MTSTYRETWFTEKMWHTIITIRDVEHEKFLWVIVNSIFKHLSYLKVLSK